jgi:membrane fusion protein, multidrug efflux system
MVVRDQSRTADREATQILVITQEGAGNDSRKKARLTMKRATPVHLLYAALLASAAATGCNHGGADGQKQKPPVIAYELPVTKTITDYEQFPGETEAIISIQVTSRVSGYMDEVKFKDGDMVKEGDVLFKIDPRQYKAELERAEGNLQQLEAHRNRQEKEYHRAKILLSRGQISPEEYDRYESDFKETEAGAKLATSNRDLAKLNFDWCEVRASTSGRLSRRMVDPGNLVKADDTVLTSIVSLDPMYVYFDVNEQAMLKIQRLLDQGKVKAPSLREVPVQISLSDEGEDSFPHTGIVDFTDNKVDINTGTLRFRSKLENKDHFIIPGLVVRVRLPIGDPHPAVFIRETALVTDQGEKGVYIIRERDEKGEPFPNAIDKKGKPFFDEKEPLAQVAFWSKIGNPGAAHDKLVEITNGVRGGDWVVVSDMQRLKNGKAVTAVKFADGATKKDEAKAAGIPQDTFVTYDLPIEQTVTDYEEIQGESEAMFSVQVTARVSGYMTEVKFKDGELVKAGDLLFQIDSRPFKAALDRAEGNLQQNEAHKVRLEKEYHRAKNLIGRGSISSEEFDRYESDFKETEAGVRLAKADRDLAQLNYDWCKVRASTSGRLSRRMVDPGNLVKADDTVLTSIVSLDPMYVYFDVHEQAMLRIKHLMEQGKVAARSLREVPVDISLADEGDDKFPHRGMIDFTDNKVDFTRGTLAFRAKLDNKDHLLTPGLFVRVRLPIGESHTAVMVRERALVTDHKEKGVFILRDHDKDGKPLAAGKDPKGNPVPVRRPVWSPVGNPGVVRNGYVEIGKGVRPGDWVVVSGMQRLKTNEPDKVVKVERFSAGTPTGEAHANPESTALAPKAPGERAQLPE